MNLTDKRFQDQNEARRWLEEQRWPMALGAPIVATPTLTVLRPCMARRTVKASTSAMRRNAACGFL
jgi:hypothetical protein